MPALRRLCALLPAALLSAALFPAAVLLGGHAALAQSYSRTLNDVRVSLANGQELVTLTFSAPVEDNPIEEHQPGSFRLRFSATGSKVSNNLFQLKEQSTIQDYRIVPTAYATEVHVALRDPHQNLQGRLGFERNNNVLTVRLPTSTVARAGGATDQAILAQAERRLSGETLPPAPPSAQTQTQSPPAPLGKADSATAVEEGWLSTLLTMAVALAVVLGLLYGLVWVYNRYLAGRLGSRMGQYPVKHLGSFAVGPRQRIVILDINGEVIACGVTPQHISLVARLSATRPSAPARKPAPPAAPAQASAGAPVASSVQVVKDTGSKDSGKDPVHTFAETLKEKVRSLKRLK
jgi:flagellar protein FliO/FliZ